RDPALLLWVQATLVLTSLRLYEAVAGRLAHADREAYWQETRPIAQALGIPPALQPATPADLERYERLMLATAVRPDATSMAVMKPFERFARIAPTALGLHVGIALLALAALGILFSPNLHPSDEPLGRAILVVEAMCGLMLLLGLATRAAAVLLALLGIAAMQ